MKKLLYLPCTLLVAFLFCLCLKSCFPVRPSFESIETHFRNNYEDIQIIVEFISGSTYNSVFINTSDGTMLADLETLEIEDENVKKAIKRLLGGTFVRERQYYSVSMSGNTIWLLQWKSPQDVGCGVTYSINKTDIMDAMDYITELVPLSEAGWYCYVDDYNAWRTGKHP